MKQFANHKSLLATLSIAAICSTFVFACNKKGPTHQEAGSIDISLADDKTTYLPEDFGQAIVKNENGEIYTDVSYSTRNSSVINIDSETGEFQALQPGVTDIIALGKDDQTLIDSIEVTVTGTPANGNFSYATASWEDKAEIISVLERYGQDTYLTGIPFCGDGQYVMYNPRVNFPTNEYVEGFGYGVTEYGTLNPDMPLDVTSYGNYYHTYTSENPNSLADWNANNSLISDLTSYMSSGYFTTIFNAGMNDYEYMPLLAAKDNFIALDATSGADPQATQFKLYVKTDGVYYDTNSKNPIASKFDHREVQLEDYLTPFKILLTSDFNLYRGSEMTAESYARPIKGAAEYWEATRSDTIDGVNEEAFEEYVGVKVGTDDEGDYITFEFSQPVSVNDARSNLSLNYWSPLPMDFFTEVLGGDAELYGTYNSSGSLSPVDTTLSLGPYTPSVYNANEIVFEQNEDYIGKIDTYDREMYKIPGIYVDVLEGVLQDSTLAFREFQSNHLDQCSIPGTLLDQYKNDPRTKQVPETTTWKVNINATTEDLWVSLFGEDGTIYKNSRDNYWNVKPIMSNRHFLDGLYYSINRSEYATSQNYSVSQNYLSDAYYLTDDKGEMHVYNETSAHQNAIKDRYPNSFGYNLDAARAMFRLAIQEEVEAGHYKYGTASNPTIITLDAKWMTTSSMEKMGEPITQYMETAFNSVDPRIQLKINNTVAGASSDAMYDALEQGQFDIGLGAITGMQMYPLEFMNVLCSDNRAGFVLNWSVDTGVNDGAIYYDGKTWSYDALWSAAVGQLQNAVNGEEGESPMDISYSSPIRTVNTATQDVTYRINNLTFKALGNNQVELEQIEILDRATEENFVLDVTSGYNATSNSLEFKIPQGFNYSYTDMGMPEYSSYDYQFTLRFTFKVYSAIGEYDYTFDFPSILYAFPWNRK